MALPDWGKPVLVLVLTLLAVWQVYLLGQQHVGFELITVRDMLREQERLNAGLVHENEALQERMAILERSIQIDDEAYGEVARNLRKLEADLLQQQEELAFYRGIVSPAYAKTGLRIQSLELTPGVTPQHYRYSLLLTQVTRNNRDIQGVAEIKIHGSQGGSPQSLTLTEVSRPTLESWNFQFRYFQTLEGELQLPAGFLPDTIQVEVLPVGTGMPKLERSFGWPS